MHLIRKPSSEQGRDRRLTEGEEKRLIEAAEKYSKPIIGWLVRLALYTGMRSGELVSLSRDQVNLDRRIVKLSETKNGSARTVSLSIEATNVFRAALDNPTT